MGKMLEKNAISRWHQIVCRIDLANMNDFSSAEFASADVALEFTTPATAEQNIRKAWAAGVKVVCGTTGWHKNLPTLQEELKTNSKALFWASNFSLGVNIFFEINRKLAQIMNNFPQYEVAITETHHTEKKDIPSGTAITLADNILSQLDRKNSWALAPKTSEENIEISAIRQGSVAGIHTVEYSSREDVISLTHSANGREGFALGAIIAAEFLQDKIGYFSMENLLKY
jgi:4-hydroxy-tetrahydrodipicolinate reductase